MRIKRKKLSSLWGTIINLLEMKSSVKFKYLLLKNKNILEPEIQSFQNAQEASEEAREYETKRHNLCIQFSDRKEDGSVLKDEITNSYIISNKNREEFDKAIDLLKEEYPDAPAELQEIQTQLVSFMEELVEIDFIKIPLSMLPESVTGQDIEALFDLIEEDTAS